MGNRFNRPHIGVEREIGGIVHGVEQHPVAAWFVRLETEVHRGHSAVRLLNRDPEDVRKVIISRLVILAGRVISNDEEVLLEIPAGERRERGDVPRIGHAGLAEEAKARVRNRANLVAVVLSTGTGN